MKRHLYTSLLAGAGLLTGLGACQLTELPPSLLVAENTYQTAQDAEAGLNAAYNGIAQLYSAGGAIIVSDFSADQSYPRPVVGRNTLTLFTYDVQYSNAGQTGENPRDLWGFCYGGIERSNWVIEKVPGIAMDARRRDEIVGEALFLRAYYHFFLAKNFGDVIVKTRPTKQESDAFNAKSPRAEVYRQILQDLDEAAAKLPSYSASLARGRACKEAAQGLSAKAALYAENWSQALQRAQAVLASGRYALLPNVLDVFDVNKKDQARNEVLFYFESNRNAPPGFRSALMNLAGPPGSAGRDYGNQSFGSWFAYQSFFNSFDPRDARRRLLDTTYVNRAGAVVPQRSISPITTQAVLIGKYKDPQSNNDAMGCLVPILRLADVYLIAAEAEARQNGPTALAYGYLNAVRQRAGLPALAAGLGREAFVGAVLQERSWEFFGEGDRWYDLTRTNTFPDAVRRATNNVYPDRSGVAARHRYFPIPFNELQANPALAQNPDWE